MNDVMQRLRESTRQMHMAAESHPFQMALGRGKLPRELFVRYLEQLFLVHGYLELLLRQYRDQVPAIAKAVKEYQYQEQYLRKDLEFFGVDPEILQPNAATLDILGKLERSARTEPAALLGYHYVLEGSKNGSRYAAANIRTAYGLPDGKGSLYLDPYGDKQLEFWKEFKQDVSSEDLSAAEQELIIEAANQMFDAVAAIGNEILNAASPDELGDLAV